MFLRGCGRELSHAFFPAFGFTLTKQQHIFDKNLDPPT